MLLTNTVHSSNGLKLESRIHKWLAKKDVIGIDEVKTARVGPCVEKEYLNGRVLFEASGAPVAVDGCKADSEALESSGYAGQVCGGQSGRTRRDVVSGLQHFVFFLRLNVGEDYHTAERVSSSVFEREPYVTS